MALKDICFGSLFKVERNGSGGNQKKVAPRERPWAMGLHLQGTHLLLSQAGLSHQKPAFSKRTVFARVSQIEPIECAFP